MIGGMVARSGYTLVAPWACNQVNSTVNTSSGVALVSKSAVSSIQRVSSQCAKNHIDLQSPQKLAQVPKLIVEKNHKISLKTQRNMRH